MKKIIDNIIWFFKRLFNTVDYKSIDAFSWMSKAIYPIFKKYKEEAPNHVPIFDIVRNMYEPLEGTFGEERLENYITNPEADKELDNHINRCWVIILEQIEYALYWVSSGEELPLKLNPDYDISKPEGIEWIKTEGGSYELKSNLKLIIDIEKSDIIYEQVDAGFILLGLYWRNFWL